MRLAILTTSYPRSAADESGIFIKRYVAGLSQCGATGLVFVPQDNLEVATEQQENFVIKRFKYGIFFKGQLAFGQGIFPNLKSRPWLALQIPGLLLGFFCSLIRERKNLDLVHANWIFSGFAAWLAYHCCGLPYTISLLGVDVKLLKIGWLRLLFRPVLRSAKVIICINQDFSNFVSEKFKLSADRLCVIPNGVDLPEIQPQALEQFIRQEQIEKLQPFLLFVGRVIELKRVLVLIDLLKEKSLANYRLVICGRADADYLEKICKAAEKYSVASRVHYLGPVAPQQVNFYLKSAAVYLTASSYEGRPNSVLEAMAAGCPVLASDITAHREIIENGTNGFLFSPDNLTQAAEKIIQLSQDSALKEKIVSQALTEVSKFSWKNCADEHLNVFRRVNSN